MYDPLEILAFCLDHHQARSIIFTPKWGTTRVPVPCISKPHLPFLCEMLTHLKLMHISFCHILLGGDWNCEKNWNYQRKSNYVQVTCAERKCSLYFCPACSCSVFVPLQLKFAHHIICACSHPLLLPVRSIFLFPPSFYLLCLSYQFFFVMHWLFEKLALLSFICLV